MTTAELLYFERMPHSCRWTRRTPIVSEDKLDAERISWLEEAYQCSITK